ncbi:MAG: hypothetical protein KA133_11765, partial [Flavobacterium sp.]|nr:hypothetical protein [Flavobacterium sp.]
NNAAIPDSLTKQLQVLPKNSVSDLVYLQTSKSIYETEEDLWFKGYVLDAQYFYPSRQSKTLFVQLIEDKTDQVVWEKKYEIENGFVDGHLFLKSELTEGMYTLAAYSFHSVDSNAKEFYAAKKLEIQKTIKRKTTVAPIQKDSIVLFTTYPEGGKLVSGIESTLAFKAVNSKGLPVEVLGTLFENNVPLIPFKSSHAGMGGFDFKPDVNKKYHIQLTELASDKMYDIATIEPSGKAIHLLGNTKEAVFFKIAQSDGLKEETVYLRLQMRGIVYGMVTDLLKKELICKIPLNGVPQGIAEVTLFDKNAIPLAERLVYVNQDHKLTIKTELNQSGFATRDKANLKIKVTDEKGQPIVAHLGVSVYEGLYQNKQDSKSIESHYLLSTQLKGNIYDPAYYFNEQNKDRKQALNLLMLTQGWRNYVWNEGNLKLQGNSLPIVFEEMEGKVRLMNPNDTVLGKIRNYSKSRMEAIRKTREIKKKGIFIMSGDESKGKNFIMTDTTGRFTVGPKELKKGEGGNTYFQLITRKLINDAPEPKYLINVMDVSFEEINKQRKDKAILYPMPKIEKPNEKAAAPLMDRITINKLREVVISSKKKYRDKFIGKLDSLARLKDYVCRFNILNCLNHMGEYDNRKPREGQIYEGAGGIPYHYGDRTEAELLARLNVAKLEGYYGKKVFYETVYDEVTITDSLPDFRNTLFWKSDIITDKDGEANVDFFCSDINSLFIGNIEGVSGNGLLGVDNFEFKVGKKVN